MLKMKLSDRIEALAQLGNYLHHLAGAEIEEMIAKAEAFNPWFSKENIRLALSSIRDEMLSHKALEDWMENYKGMDTIVPKKVGLILAGNIPAVGFHDVLCVLISGHYALIKMSDKDKIIIPFLLDHLVRIQPTFAHQFEWVDQLKNIDAVIATGSDNTGVYFQSYFGKYPNIIRRHRNSVAVLDGQENADDIRLLGKDIFQYFGLGCRNVSKLYLPVGYPITFLLEVLHEYNDIIYHHKYKNNFDYNIALYLINRVKYVNNGCLILVEDPRLTSRIASLHYEYYKNENELSNLLEANKDGIQCVVSKKAMNGIDVVPFGHSQMPGLRDYADGIDTMSFLKNL